ncbi:MAG: flagellar hook-basal body complex protein FliE [Burkholderiaceae bacterium]|nr:flagellar hook-basal body complex protein FliE [Burkholderiaceae bacterium]
MNVDAISFLPAVAEPTLTPMAEAAGSSPVGGAFASWFEQHLRELNTQMVEADRGVQKLAAGDASNLHEVMMNLQEARMSMQLMMQVRNHLLDAYHDIAQMQL